MQQRIDFELHNQEFDSLGLELDDDMRDGALAALFGDPSASVEAFSAFSAEFAQHFTDDLARQIAVEQELGPNEYNAWRAEAYAEADIEVSPRYGTWDGESGQVTPPPGPIGSATTQGLEVTLAARPLDNLALSLNYTYTDAINNETDQSLLRRAPHKVGGSVSWQYVPKGNITASLVYSGSRADIDPVSFGRTRIGTYTLLNVATSYQLTENLSIFGRVENVLDADYEEVAGFGTAEISFYGGLKLSF